MQVEEILISNIEDNPYQTREKIELEALKLLTKSIRERGLFNPVTVIREGDSFILVSGHRRVAAYKRMKKKYIPAFVKKRKSNSLIVDMVHENLIREDLTPLEKANSIRLLLAQIESTRNDPERMYTLINMLKNWKRRGSFPEHRKKRTEGFEENDIFRVMEILKSIGISENNAVTYLMLLRLPRHMAEQIIFNKRGVQAKGKIVLKQAEQLARIKDPKYRDYLYRRCINGATCKIIQALANMHVEKVEKGEWEGFSQTYNTSVHKFKDDITVMESLSEDCSKISARISSFKVDTLLKLEETLEKDNFIAHLADLRKELKLLDNSILSKLKDKGYRPVKEKIDLFEVALRFNEKKRHFRFTMPMKIIKQLRMEDRDKIFAKLKIAEVRK
jgi:hypothetical protein